MGFEINPSCDGNTDGTAVKREAAFPDGHGFEGTLQIIREIVKQDIAEAAADDDAENQRDEEIVFLGGVEWKFTALQGPPANSES